ncbi:MAG: cytochrome-c peroxidase [Verrucomicrobiota bacterium]
MTKRILFLSVLAAAATTVVAQSPSDLRKKALEVLAPLPDKMPGAENDTPALVSLGKKLYFEKRLSANNSQSCNSCHQVDGGKSGVDLEPTSPGAFGKRGGRNSPTTLNAGFHLAQFWDGRAADLAAQAKGPILNPGEMAMPSEAAVIEKLSGIPSYKRDFAKAFPDQASPLTYDNLAKSIAAFERTLVTHDRFDDFLKGNDKALSAAEQKGLETFISVGCTTCHNGPAIGGNGFRKVGAVNPYKNLADKGRIEITKEEEDLHVFKVPALRNVALTAPYFHDGAMKSLADTVREMAWLQLGQKLGDDQVQSIVSFLRALNGKGRKGKDAIASVDAPSHGALPAMP